MPTGTEYGYKDLMDSIDTIIMGGKTYRAVLDMDFGGHIQTKRAISFLTATQILRRPRM